MINTNLEPTVLIVHDDHEDHDMINVSRDGKRRDNVGLVDLFRYVEQIVRSLDTLFASLPIMLALQCRTFFRSS